MTDPHHPREIRLLLPPGWHPVPLTDPEATQVSLDALVTLQVGAAEHLAPLRTQLTTELRAAAEGAAASGAVLMAFSTMRAGDAPLPASMTVYQVPGLQLDDAGVTTLREALGPGEDWADRTSEHGRLVRRTRVVKDDGQPGQLLADYWITGDQPGETVSIVFATPLLQLAEAMLELFDAVVTSAQIGTPGG